MPTAYGEDQASIHHVGFVAHGATYRCTEETHTQTLYSPAAMLTLLRRAGFKPTLTGALAPGHYAVTAR